MIDIESMTKQELVALHQRVADRIRYLHQMEAQEKMNSFYFGDVVTFTTREGRTIRGTVKRFNQKSVSVECEHGTRWTVSPQLLKGSRSNKLNSLISHRDHRAIFVEVVRV